MHCGSYRDCWPQVPVLHGGNHCRPGRPGVRGVALGDHPDHHLGGAGHQRRELVVPVSAASDKKLIAVATGFAALALGVGVLTAPERHPSPPAEQRPDAGPDAGREPVAVAAEPTPVCPGSQTLLPHGICQDPE